MRFDGVDDFLKSVWGLDPSSGDSSLRWISLGCAALGEDEEAGVTLAREFPSGGVPFEGGGTGGSARLTYLSSSAPLDRIWHVERDTRKWRRWTCWPQKVFA